MLKFQMCQENVQTAKQFVFVAVSHRQLNYFSWQLATANLNCFLGS